MSTPSLSITLSRLLLTSVSLLALSCSSTTTRRLYAADTGLRSVEVVEVQTSDPKLNRTVRKLLVSDKPEIVFEPFSETSTVEQREAPFHAVGAPPAPIERRNIVYLPASSFTEDEAYSIARLLGSTEDREKHGIDGLRVGSPESLEQRFESPGGKTTVVVSVDGAAWLEGANTGHLGRLESQKTLVLHSYAPDFLAPEALQGQPPRPSVEELGRFVDRREGKTLGQTYTLQVPKSSSPTPAATPEASKP